MRESYSRGLGMTRHRYASIQPTRTKAAWSATEPFPARPRPAVERVADGRAHLARDAYSYLHLPLVAGIMLFAVGAHATIEHATHRLPLLSAIALAGGMALFYFADVAYRWRDHGQAPADRAVTGVAAAATLPALLHMPALAALGLLAGIGACRLVWELWRRPRIGPAVAGQAR